VNVLEIRNVNKTFGDVRAVQNLQLEVEEGQIYGLLGPNGAGKTTTIRMIMNIILPDTGEIRIFGQPVTLELLRSVGYLPEERGLYRKMKVKEVIRFFAELKGMDRSQIEKEMKHWLERLDLLEWQEEKVEELSRGMQQKVQFILTVIHRPRLLILDEPFTGLDPVNTDLLKDILLEMNRQGATIILSTHLMEQVEKMCDAICLINRGRAVLQGPLAEIKQRYGKNHVLLEYDGDAEFLDGHPLVEKVSDFGRYMEIYLKDEADPQTFLRELTSQVEIFRFELAEPSLHEIFVDTVRRMEEQHA
jgi:ABC-2 type transport system ATP-binding protein